MKKIWMILAGAAFLVMIYINYLSVTGQINGMYTGQVSALYPTYFTPAGYTFSIWGIIYLFNIAFIIYALIGTFFHPNDYPPLRILQMYFVTCLLNSGWIIAWHYQAILVCMVLMIFLLIVLYTIYQEVTAEYERFVPQYIVAVIPFSLYLGWIVVATLANFAVLINDLKWVGMDFPAAYLATGLIVLATVLNIYILIKKKDLFFALVFLWSAMGIISARRAEGTAEAHIVAIAALSGMVLVFLCMIFMRFFVIRKESK